MKVCTRLDTGKTMHCDFHVFSTFTSDPCNIRYNRFLVEDKIQCHHYQWRTKVVYILQLKHPIFASKVHIDYCLQISQCYILFNIHFVWRLLICCSRHLPINFEVPDVNVVMYSRNFHITSVAFGCNWKGTHRWHCFAPWQLNLKPSLILFIGWKTSRYNSDLYQYEFEPIDWVLKGSFAPGADLCRTGNDLFGIRSLMSKLVVVCR